jgi:UDP-N-acetylglucosamine 2-epimerase (non-hydrolysing)
MPEEHNRRLTDHLSSLLLTHSLDGNDNLAREGIHPDGVRLVGNTMIDTLFANVGRARRLAVWRRLGLRSGGYLLVTLHRPALVDDPDLLAATMGALVSIARELPVVFPVHPRTRARLEAIGVDHRGVHLVEPLPYRRFLSLQAGARAVVTDSGGVQEETTALGVPCFTLRENTERPVTVTHGTNVVLGLDPARLAEIPDRHTRARVKAQAPPLWDGAAGPRAAVEIERFLGLVPAPSGRPDATTPRGAPLVPIAGRPMP